MLRRKFNAGLASLVLFSPLSLPSVAIAASFQGLGDLPGGSVSSSAAAVSADGSVVVGGSSSGELAEAFRWTAETGMVALGDLPGGLRQSIGESVSGNGSVVVGFASGEGGTTAFRWTASDGMKELGEYPEQGTIYAYDVSADGSTTVGVGRGFFGGQLPSQAVFWTADGQPHPIAGPSDSRDSNAYGVSADGSVIVGNVIMTVPERHFEAFRWTAETGMVPLGDLPGGATSSTANEVTADGSVVVGGSSSGIGSEAFRWTAAEGMRGLGILPGWESSSAQGVSNDGSIIIGTLFRGDPRANPEFSSFIWDENRGMRYFQEAMEEEVGLDLAGWTTIGANAISADGTTIVGTGRNSQGQPEAFIAVIPEPASSALIVATAVCLSLRRRR